MKKNVIFWITFNIAENHYINIKKKKCLRMVGYRVYFCFVVVKKMFNIYPYYLICIKYKHFNSIL